VGQAHARYFLDMAGRAAPELVGPRQREWFLRLEQERENLGVALQWLWDHGDDELAGRMVAALGYFWQMRGYHREGIQALEEALDHVPVEDSGLRATLLNRLGNLLAFQGQSERARAVLEEALTLGRALGDAPITAEALSNLGRLAENVRLSEEQMQEGRPLLEEALALYRDLGDGRSAAFVQTHLAVVAFGQRRYDKAEQLWHEALVTHREIGAETNATYTLLFLGLAAGEQNQTARAATLLREALEAIRRLRDRRLLLLECHVIIWWLGGEQGEPERLATLLGAAEALSDANSSFLNRSRQSRTPQAAAALRARLGREAFEAAYREGRRLSFSQISELIVRVLNEVDAGRTGSEDAGYPLGEVSEGEPRRQSLLSKREDEVLQLVAEGLTNKEIAKRLILSENTVKVHVTSLFKKLGVNSRAQAVAIAAPQGFLDQATGSTSKGS
jgi:DNA-binding NarL/FixJ family response regulator